MADFVDEATPQDIIGAAESVGFDLKELAEALDALGPEALEVEELEAVGESLVKAQLTLEAILAEISEHIKNR